MIRLFVGLKLPDDLRDVLSIMERGIPGARWVASDNFHVTLRFIGDVAEHEAEDIDSSLRAIRARNFPLTLTGVGHFGKLRSARSIWTGVHANPALKHLQAKVESAIVRAGFATEKRRFKPHVTLARIKGETGHHLANFLSEHGDFRAPPFPVTAFHLYQSHLGRNGAAYEMLCSYPLE
ncbi:MAG: RNA 2',3'-cyclic phosphodiesterase [Rhodospirillaceae bacterium]|nr:RNA 2',3'-cyclic phosphodiesterase [Rhodospirillaceae bacterium]MCY4238462.1 RNA 2',3'-cyclic phosphodiesterase [Rhodospirillaceae bacterium]